MPMVRAMRLLNSIEAGATSGAQLQTLLAADPGRLAELNVLLSMRGQLRRMLAASTTMTAIAGSAAAMGAVIASSPTLAAMLASSTAKMAFFNSDVALNALKGSATAMAAMRADAKYSVQSHTANNVPIAIPGLVAGGSYILLGFSKNNTISQAISAIATRRSGTTQPASYAAITNPISTTASDVDIATPLVAPFTATHSANINYVWYYGLLRCDV